MVNIKSTKDDISTKVDLQAEDDVKGGFSSRLRVLMGENVLKQVDLASLSGESTSVISNYVRGEKMPSATALIKISQALSVRPEWLLFGTGDKTEKAALLRSPDVHYVPILDIQLAAGHGAWNPAEIVNGHMAFDDEMLSSFGRTHAEGLFVARVGGDSNYPLLSDGDPVLIDSSDKRIRESLFAFRLGEDLRIKTLRKIGLNAVEAISTNPLYPPERIEGPDLEHFAVIGRVLFAWKKF